MQTRFSIYFYNNDISIFLALALVQYFISLWKTEVNRLFMIEID